MTRKNLSALPSVDYTPIDLPPAEQAEPTQMRLIEVPLSVEREGYCSRHIQVQLNDSQAKTLKRLFCGLDESAAKLANGKYVSNTADVLRWLLEQVAKGE